MLQPSRAVGTSVRWQVFTALPCRGFIATILHGLLPEFNALWLSHFWTAVDRPSLASCRSRTREHACLTA